MIELSTIDESGSGVLFPTLLNPDDIIAVISVKGHADTMPDAECCIFLRDTPRPVFTTATYANLREILK